MEMRVRHGRAERELQLAFRALEREPKYDGLRHDSLVMVVVVWERLVLVVVVRERLVLVVVVWKPVVVVVVGGGWWPGVRSKVWGGRW
jgi:hypothetical protein